MRILWIGSLAWKENNTYKYPVNGPGAISGSLFEQSIIEGLEKLGNLVEIISDYPYAPKKFIYNRYDWAHNNVSHNVSITSINIPYISILFKDFFIQKEIQRKLRRNTYDLVIAYLIHQPYMNGLLRAKNIDNNIRTILICPDLPNMMDMSLQSKTVKNILKNMDYRRIEKLYDSVDGFVLFADAMKEMLPVGNKPYIVIEGVASIDELDIAPVSKQKAIMYAGTLHRNIGIEQIIQVMNFIKDPDFQLWIFGTGDLAEDISQAVLKDNRIKYYGFISREELFIYQKKALAVINARNPLDAYTKYSFPSKSFEYLYSGTPYVTTRLNGIPKEYDPYLYLIENNSAISIASKVLEIIHLTPNELHTRALNTQSFIREKKGQLSQTNKFNTFILQLCLK